MNLPDPREDPRILLMQGKPYPTWGYIIELAHQRGLQRLETEIVQLPSDANGQLAVVRAVATFATGVFTGIGDASPANVSRNIAPHILRMAETRAKGRALRDALAIGEPMADEMALDVSASITPAAKAPPTETETPSGHISDIEMARLCTRVGHAESIEEMSAIKSATRALEPLQRQEIDERLRVRYSFLQRAGRA